MPKISFYYKFIFLFSALWQLSCSELSNVEQAASFSFAILENNNEGVDAKSEVFYLHKSMRLEGTDSQVSSDFTQNEGPDLKTLPTGEFDISSTVLYARMPGGLSQQEKCALNVFGKAPTRKKNESTYFYSQKRQTYTSLDTQKVEFKHDTVSPLDMRVVGIALFGAETLKSPVTISFVDKMTQKAYRDPCKDALFETTFQQGEYLAIWLPLEPIAFLKMESKEATTTILDLKDLSKENRIFQVDQKGAVKADKEGELSGIKKYLDELEGYAAGTFLPESSFWLPFTSSQSFHEGDEVHLDLAKVGKKANLSCLRKDGSRCPDGLTMQNGRIDWVIGYDEAGVYDMVFTIVDKEMPDKLETSLKVTVQDKNRPPVLTCPQSSFQGSYGDTIKVTCKAEDLDGDAMTYSLSDHCLGNLSFDSGSFVLSAKIYNATCSSTLAAIDNSGLSSSLKIQLTAASSTFKVTVDGLDEGESAKITLNGDLLQLAPSEDQKITQTAGFSYEVHLKQVPDKKTCQFLQATSGQSFASLTTLTLSCQWAKVSKIAAGENHTCFLYDNATIRCLGENGQGQLGLGDTTNRLELLDQGVVQVLSSEEIFSGLKANDLVAGGDHTCALLSNGKVRCFGKNNKGQLGYGDTANLGDSSATEIYEKGDVPIDDTLTTTLLALGDEHTCALLSDQSVRCWGEGNYGRLGDGNNGADKGHQSATDISSAGSIAFGTSVVSITAGKFHTCALLSTNKVRCFGSNVYYGALGLPGQNDAGSSAAPTQETSVLTAAERSANLTITALSAGDLHTCALISNGKLRCWGNNENGQLGLNSAENFVGDDEAPSSLPMVAFSYGSAAQVALGGNHSCALVQGASSGIICFGKGGFFQTGYGQAVDLGTDTDNTPLTPIPINGTLTPDLLSLGGSHTCFKVDIGDPYCFGKGASGQVGQNATSDVTDTSLLLSIAY